MQLHINGQIYVSTQMLPEFLFSNSHVGLPPYTQIDEEQFQLLHTAAMEICDMNVLAPNLHVMPAQFKTEPLEDQGTLINLVHKDGYTRLITN